MKDETQTEHVANRVIFSLHIFDVDHLRSNVARCAASHEQIFFSIWKLGKTKVSNDQLTTPRIPENQVLGFEISVHSVFTVHFFQSIENGQSYLFGFMRFKRFFSFNLVMKKTSFEKLDHHIKRILWFEDFMESHAIFMVECSHYLDLFDQTLLSFIFTVCCFFRKGFYSKAFAAFYFFSEIHWCEISFTYFLLWLELFVESSLIELVFQYISPLLELASGSEFESDFGSFFFKVDWRGVGLEAKLEFEVKEHASFSFWRWLNETVIIDWDWHISLLDLSNCWWEN